MEQSESARRTLFEPETQPEAPPAAHQTGTPPLAPTVVAPVAEEPVVDEREDDEVPPRRFNPWLAALWVLGLALIAAGSYVNWLIYTRTVNSDPFSDGEAYWALVSVVQNFAPWFVGVGLAAIVSAVLISALDWRERHP